MDKFEWINWHPEWKEILAEQESKLRYEKFTREDALELGLKIIDLVKERGWGSAAVRITEDSSTIFAYKMSGTSQENDWWMDRKLAVSRLSGCSSLRAYVDAQTGQSAAFWDTRSDNYAPCGGCVPVFMTNGSAPWAYVLVSGLAHYHDHQIIADAMAWQLQVPISSIC